LDRSNLQIQAASYGLKCSLANYLCNLFCTALSATDPIQLFRYYGNEPRTVEEAALPGSVVEPEPEP
jgi:hypothetical protein